MKIVVSTFNNSKNNYGAVFQSCGLYSFLTKTKHDVFYVTLKNRGKPKQSAVAKIKELVKKVLLLPHARAFKRRQQKFMQFTKDTQNQIVYSTKEELFQNPPRADVYLAGSDQVWNPVAMHEDLFLAYAPKNSKKISYAASMGHEHIPECNKERFTELIKDYSAFSVREDTVVDIIKQFTDKPVYQHIDPIFLKSKEEWQLLEKPYEKLKFKKFILAYVIEWNAEHNAKLKELKKKTGLPVVSVNIGNLKKVCADQIIYDASPNEFLYLLDRADYVVASSFHGIAMSIVYNKPFLALPGQNMPTRIQSLMRHFDINMSDSINYGTEQFKAINELIVQDRSKAKEYLNQVVDLK